MGNESRTYSTWLVGPKCWETSMGLGGNDFKSGGSGLSMSTIKTFILGFSGWLDSHMSHSWRWVLSYYQIGSHMSSQRCKHVLYCNAAQWDFELYSHLRSIFLLVHVSERWWDWNSSSKQGADPHVYPPPPPPFCWWHQHDKTRAQMFERSVSWGWYSVSNNDEMDMFWTDPWVGTHVKQLSFIHGFPV